jgi:diguanylate cyclase (GGDEF)-like protein/PAS domain S-box-containing protein
MALRIMGSMEGRELRYKLSVIEFLIFALPFLVLLFIIYQSDISLNFVHVIIIGVILVIVCAGLIILRQVFNRFFDVAMSMKKAASGDQVSMEIRNDVAELRDISVAFNRLMEKFEHTTEELSQKTFELVSIKELTEIASKILDIDEMLGLLLDKSMALTGAQIGSVYMVDAASQQFRILGMKGLGKDLRNYRINMADSPATYVLMEKKALLVKDADSDPRVIRKDYPECGSPSFLSMPIFIRDEVAAVLNLASKGGNGLFDTNDEQILSIMIREIGFALENAQLHSRIKLHMEDLKKHATTLEKEITERNRAEQALRESEERYRSFLQKFRGIAFRRTIDFAPIFFHGAVEEITGYTAEEFVAENPAWDQIIHPEDFLKIHKSKENIRSIPGYSTEREYRIVCKDGQSRWVHELIQNVRDDAGKPIYIHGSLFDISDRKHMEEEIMALSMTDQLTGLHNRRGFLTLAEHQLKIADRTKKGMQLFFADLDGMKWINDKMGHKEGDNALMEVATVLKDAFRSSDIIARMGGDEFAVLAIDTSKLNPEILTNRLHNQLEALNNRENRKFRISVSVGCAYYDPEKPSAIDELMAHADKLMYEEKKKKKS